MTPLTRRELLASLGVVAAGGLLPSWGRAVGGLADRPLVAEILGYPRGAVVLGRAYLETFPEEANHGRLVACLLAEATSQNQRAFRSSLIARIRSDFDEGTVVSIRGWVLSRTEARLAGLIALELGD